MFSGLVSRLFHNVSRIDWQVGFQRSRDHTQSPSFCLKALSVRRNFVRKPILGCFPALLFFLLQHCSAVPTEPEVERATKPAPGKVSVKWPRIDPNVRARALADGHPAPAEMPLRVHVYLTMLKAQEFNRISEATMNPASPLFGHQLSPDELKQFARPMSDYEAVEHWLASFGIKILIVDAQPLVRTIRVEGTAAQFEAALDVQIYQSPDGKWFANMSDPQIPAALSEVIAGFSGLDDLSGYTAGPRVVVP
jgi:hypothetical protein